MSTTAIIEERNAIRDQLAYLRIEIETNLITATTTVNPQDIIRAVELNKEYMDLLMYFVDRGGLVVAVPLYHTNCNTSSGIIRARKRMVMQLQHFQHFYPASAIPPFLASQQRAAGQGILLSCHAVRNKQGITKHLQRLVGAPGEPSEDSAVWKWLFCDLKENEDLDTLVTEKGRWGWAGKFVLGNELEREHIFGAGPAVTSSTNTSGNPEDNFFVLA